MDTERGEPAPVVQAVATLIARSRMDVPASAYTRADAMNDNEIGWQVPCVGTLHLPADQLDAAWTVSNRMVHAWA